MILSKEIEKIKKIRSNLEKIHEHNELMLKTIENVQMLIQNHLLVLKQLVIDTEELYKLSCDIEDAHVSVEEIAKDLKIH